MHQTADRRMFAQLKVKLAQGIPSMVYIYKTKKEVNTIFSVNTTCAIHTCEIQPWERRTTKSLYPILLISEKVTRWTHQNKSYLSSKGKSENPQKWEDPNWRVKSKHLSNLSKQKTVINDILITTKSGKQTYSVRTTEEQFYSKSIAHQYCPSLE